VNVIWSPGGQVIGQATTARGAMRHAARIPLLKCERLTAGVQEVIDRNDMPDFTKCWFVGITMRTS
jgi:hypothetical protein